MDDLFSFLFFAAIIIINVVFQNSQKKSRRAKQKLPPISPPEDLSNQTRQTTDTKNTLDYMMAKPQSGQNYTDTTVIYTEPELNTDKSDNIYQKYLEREEKYRRTKTADYIQQTEIKTADTKKIQIDIAHEHIMNAIMYAQVLETPKSLHYMKRYGIKRIMHKN